MNWTPHTAGDGDGGQLHLALRSLYSGLLDDRGVEDTRRRLEGLGVQMAPAPDQFWSATSFGQSLMSESAVRCLLEHAVIAMQLAQAKATVVQSNEQLVDTLAARRVIEQAKGILMSRHQCDPDAAFMLLVAQSQRENRKLREIAGLLVDAVATSQEQ